MAKGVINLQKESGGVTKITSTDGIGITELVLPESGNIVSVDTAVTDNAIARYDGTTGEVQDSGVVIDDTGNVGIGTSNPIDKLTMYSASGNLFLRSQSGTSTLLTGVYSDGTTCVNSLGNYPLILLTNNAERMRIGTSGNLLIGTGIDNGIDKLQVNGSIISRSAHWKYTDLNDANTVDEKVIVDNYCLNIPVNDYGYVTIQVSTPYYYCMQTFTPLNSPMLFIRIMSGGTWSAWVEK